jgi:acetyl-CoA carboxylase beta subunit
MEEIHQQKPSGYKELMTQCLVLRKEKYSEELQEEMHCITSLKQSMSVTKSILLPLCP